MAKSTITISYKLEGNDQGVRNLRRQTDGLAAALKGAVRNAGALNAGALNFAAVTQGVAGASNAIASLQEAMRPLLESYNQQQEAETKLSTVMRQRMGATEGEIAAIKKLASEQQKLGIIGDEVQLAGAQQAATFLTQQQSLAQLLPAMNDLLAQQKGYTATAADAVAIGNLVGKAMQGQTGALRRVGITFTEAQEKVLKYGTESERAAMLAKVIRDNVGAMNAALAATPAGRAKQIANEFGDLKEQAGAVLSVLWPLIETLGGFSRNALAIVQLGAGIKTCAAAVTGLNMRLRVMPVLLRMTGMSASSAAAAVTAFSTSASIASRAATLLRVSIGGLMALSVVGAVIWGVAEATTYLAGKLTDASGSADKLTDAEDAAKRKQEEFQAAVSSAGGQAIATLDKLYQKATDETKSLKQRTQAAKDLQRMYPDYFGKLRTEAILVGNAAAQYRQLADDITKAAMARAAEPELTRLGGERIKLLKQQKEAKEALDRIIQEYFESKARETTAPANVTAPGATRPLPIAQPTPMQRLSNQTGKYAKINGVTDPAFVQAIAPQVHALGEIGSRLADNAAQMAEMQGYVNDANTSLLDRSQALTSGGGGGSTATQTAEKTRLQEIGDEIESLTQEYVKADAARRTAINSSIVKLREEAEGIEDLRDEAQRMPTNTIAGLTAEISRLDKVITHTVDPTKRRELQQQRDSLEEARSAAEYALKTPPQGAEAIKTYTALTAATAYWQEALDRADTAQKRLTAKTNLESLRSMQTLWAAMTDAGVASEADLGVREKLTTLRALDSALDYWQTRLLTANAEERDSIYSTIAALQRKRDAYTLTESIATRRKEADEVNTSPNRKARVQSMDYATLTEQIAQVQRELASTDLTSGQRADLEALMDTYRQWRREGVRSINTVVKAWGNVRNIGGGIKSLADSLKGGGDAWTTFCGVIDAGLQIFESVMEVVELVKRLTETSSGAETAAAASYQATASQRSAAAGEIAMASTAVTATNKLETASWAQLAAAITYATYSDERGGDDVAKGIVATMLASIAAAGIPTYAEGGIAYGPTLGIFGEYAGAANNPEVVAPLDKLRSLIEPAGMAGNVNFRLHGEVIEGVLENYTRRQSRAGRKSKIK